MLTYSFNSQNSRVKAFDRIGPRMKKKKASNSNNKRTTNIILIISLSRLNSYLICGCHIERSSSRKGRCSDLRVENNFELITLKCVSLDYYFHYHSLFFSY